MKNETGISIDRGDPEGSQSGDLTVLLRDWREGRQEAVEKLFPLVYSELKRMAARSMRMECPGHTLTPTALVHEAYLKLLGSEVDWQDRVHFFTLASTVMRRILVDHAKGRLRQKRGAGAIKVPLDEIIISADSSSQQIVELDEAMARLQEAAPRIARIVELHYFGGLNYEEIAEVTDASRSTINRELRFGKAWLRKELMPL